MDNDASTETQETPISKAATGLGGTTYALTGQRLNEIVKALRDCGTEEIIKLPKIAFEREMRTPPPIPPTER
jgi:hypothetical protein